MSTAADHSEADGWEQVVGTRELLKKTLRRAPRADDASEDDDETEGRLGMAPQTVRLRYRWRVLRADEDVAAVRDAGAGAGAAEDATVILGHGDVVPGLDMGVALMREGETALFVVAPKFAYGALGWAPHVPPDATLLYEVEVLEARELPAPGEMAPQQRIELATSRKERGNWFYRRADYEQAANLYGKAIKLLEDFPQQDAARHTAARLLSANVHANLATAQFKLGADALVLESCRKCLALDPANIKALYYQARVQHKRLDYDDALQSLRTLLLHAPEETEARTLLHEVRTAKDEHKRSERQLYAAMLKGADYADRVAAPAAGGASSTSASASTVALDQTDAGELMPGLLTREPEQTPFGKWLSRYSPYLAQHYRSADLYGGLALFVGAVALFASFLFV